MGARLGSLILTADVLKKSLVRRLKSTKYGPFDVETYSIYLWPGPQPKLYPVRGRFIFLCL
jgi:hypothetical protein